jgi:hypothetical protein
MPVFIRVESRLFVVELNGQGSSAWLGRRDLKDLNSATRNRVHRVFGYAPGALSQGGGSHLINRSRWCGQRFSLATKPYLFRMEHYPVSPREPGKKTVWPSLFSHLCCLCYLLFTRMVRSWRFDITIPARPGREGTQRSLVFRSGSPISMPCPDTSCPGCPNARLFSQAAGTVVFGSPHVSDRQSRLARGCLDVDDFVRVVKKAQPHMSRSGVLPYVTCFEQGLEV